jgi:hypothetical protein
MMLDSMFEAAADFVADADRARTTKHTSGQAISGHSRQRGWGGGQEVRMGLIHQMKTEQLT